jgi:peptide/nickel transport system ATP-binding protein
MAMKPDELLTVDNLSATYKLPRGRQLTAVADVSFTVYKGETLGLVGESGCGKSTVGRSIMQLPPPTGGSVIYEGRDLASLDAEALRRTRTRLHMIFQDPMSSLNPRRKVRDIVAEPMAIAGVGSAEERGRRVRIALEAVGLDPDRVIDRRPHEFSGGQCQRIAIARADHGAASRRLRRTGLGARRLGARANPQPAGGYEGALWPDAAVHQP